MLRGTTPPVRQRGVASRCVRRPRLNLLNIDKNPGKSWNKIFRSKNRKQNPETHDCLPLLAKNYNPSHIFGSLDSNIAKPHFWLFGLKNRHPSRTFGSLDSKIATPLALLALWTQKLPPLSHFCLFARISKISPGNIQQLANARKARWRNSASATG